MRPAAARTTPHRPFAQAHRVAGFEHLRVGQAGVGHVRVHGTGPVEVQPRAGAAANRLVVPERLRPAAPEQEIVHRSLARRHDPERAEDHVYEALRGLDVAAADRRTPRRIGVGRRVEDRAERDDERDRS